MGPDSDLTKVYTTYSVLRKYIGNTSQHLMWHFHTSSKNMARGEKITDHFPAIFSEISLAGDLEIPCEISPTNSLSPFTIDCSLSTKSPNEFKDISFEP